MSKYDYTVVMPCLNEERTLRNCITVIKRTADINNRKIEIIVADNGSTDDSQKIAKNEKVNLVHVQKRGYGAAIDAGIKTSSTDYVIIADADMSYDFSQSEVFFQTLLKTDADLVMGNRFQGGIMKDAMPWLHKYVGNPALSSIARIFFGIPIGDFHCGMRGLKKSSYLAVNPVSSGMEFATEMIIKFADNNQKIVEIPTTLVPDGRDRKPHLRSFPDGWRHLKLMLLYAPQFFLIFPGFILSLLGAIPLIMFACLGQINLGFAKTDVQGSIFSLAIFLLGIQLFSSGSIAVAYAKLKGTGNFRWLPVPKYSPGRAKFVILIPRIMAIVGLVLILAFLGNWIVNGYQHVDPIIGMRESIPALALFLAGTQLMASQILVRQIISSLW